MSIKKVTLRKCVGCNQMFDRTTLFRVVKTPDKVLLDLSQKTDGRGAYVCKNQSCIDAAIKRKSFNRGLKCAISDEVVNQLFMELENGSR